jgi:tetratricopeptide (TPR) repeat protein
MRRTQIVSALIAALLLGFAVWAVSASAADPVAPKTPAAPADAKKDAAANPTGDAAQDNPENPLPSIKTDQLPKMPEMDAAEAKFKEGDADGALTKLNEAHKKNPDLPPGSVILASWFAQVQYPAGVRTYLEKAVTDEPGDPEAFILMSDIALREQRYTESKLLLEKADILMNSFSGSPKRKEIMLPRIPSGLAATAESRNDWATAQKYLNEWLKLEPKSVGALQQLSFCLFQQKNAAGALEKLNEAAKILKETLKPEEYLVQYLTPEAIISKYYERAGDRDKARQYVIAALKRDPTVLRTRLFATNWAFETQQYDEAKTQAAAAMKIDPRSMDAKMLAGVVALFLKDFKAAEVYCASALEQSPKSFAASNNLAMALCEQDSKQKRERALEYAEVNARAYTKQGDPKAVEAASTYGWVLYKLGRLDEAEKALRAAASLANGNFGADTAYYMAVISYDRLRGEDAKQLLERALKNNGPFMNRKEASELYKKVTKK